MSQNKEIFLQLLDNSGPMEWAWAYKKIRMSIVINGIFHPIGGDQ